MRCVVVLIWVLLGACTLFRVTAARPFVVLRGGDGTLSLHAHDSGLTSDAVATGEFHDDIEKTGWSRLNVRTNPAFPAEQQALAAGYLEGALSHERISQAHFNLGHSFHGNGTTPHEIVSFMKKNIAWMHAQIEEHAPRDPYWRHVALILAQVQGLMKGYNNHCAKGETLTFVDAWILNSGGDMMDLFEALMPRDVRLAAHLAEPGPYNNDIPYTIYRGHCSALIRVTEDNKELLTGHVTWAMLNMMLRVFKTYDFPFVETGSRHLFSSYPGFLSSGDDFYMLDSGLVVQETTIGVADDSLYKQITPKSVLEWVRVLVANRLARSGEEWTELFARYQSGTYNNEWMIVDHNKFTPGQPLVPGTLWILNQIPGYIEKADITDLLTKQRYFPSYNVPYFPDVFNRSGWPALVEKYGDWFTYEKTPRANIFRRDAPTVESLDAFRTLLWSNNFQKDPLSQGNAVNAISSRADLNPPDHKYPFSALGHSCQGGIDAKVTSHSMFRANFGCLAVSSPTWAQQKPFAWSESDFSEHDWPRRGLPDRWQFSWMEMSPPTDL